MSTEIIFDFSEIPVSVNKLYFSRGGRKILSAAGRRFKNKFLAERGGTTVKDLASFIPDPEARYKIDLTFFLVEARLYNVTYGQDKRVKSPYKDIDVSNMIKLVEDCVAALTGVRDRNNFVVHSKKVEAPSDGVLVRYTQLGV